MGEKVYRPIVKNGDHLIHSKDNPDRVRGLTRDANNQNPDIIEWEECDLDDLRSNDYDPRPYEEEHSQPTLGQEVIGGYAEEIGRVLADYTIELWKNKTWPWIKKKGHGIKSAVTDKKAQKSTKTSTAKDKKTTAPDKLLAEVSTQIDKAFEPFYMNEEEARIHMMRLIYHMLGVVNEIRIISNTRICKDCESEALCIERQKEAEKFLSERVALCLDQLLSNESLQLDLNTSRELFSLTGGGVRLNGEYVPVQAMKIDEALKALPIAEN